MTSTSVQRARQREYSATYREGKRDRRSPERRDVAEAISSWVMESGKAGTEAYVVERLIRAGFDRSESQKEVARLFRDALIARSDREIRQDR